MMFPNLFSKILTYSQIYIDSIYIVLVVRAFSPILSIQAWVLTSGTTYLHSYTSYIHILENGTLQSEMSLITKPVD
jgi:hypothetical protein